MLVRKTLAELERCIVPVSTTCLQSGSQEKQAGKAKVCVYANTLKLSVPDTPAHWGQHFSVLFLR